MKVQFQMKVYMATTVNVIKNGGKYTSCSRTEKSGRESRTGGTCKKRLNAHSLLREICIGELPTPFSFHVIFKTVQLTKHYIYQEQESFVYIKINLTIRYH